MEGRNHRKFSSQSEQMNKTAAPAPVTEEITSTGEMEYVNARASTVQLISLHEAANGAAAIEVRLPNSKPRLIVL